MYKILIAEDDTALAAAMKKHIGSWDYSVRCVRNFENIIPEFTEFDPHIVLLDIMLPFYNGYHWCTQLRRISNVPIVFISSASDNMNIVMQSGHNIQMILSWGTGVIAVFAVIFLFYTNSFIIRRRKKEFGLYNILGM